MNAALANSSPKAYLLARHEELSRTYESWVLAFRATSHAKVSTLRVPSLRPLVGARTIFHMAMGTLASTLYQFVLTRWQAMTILLSCLAVFLTLEITRRFSVSWNHFLTRKVFRVIARPHEYHSTNSATYYLIALCLVAPFFSKPAVLVGVLILAFSDPAAAWLGKKYGRVKLHKQKSYVGTATFIAVGIAVSATFLSLFYPEIALWRRMLVPALASTAAAIAEVYSGRLDDNLTIPIAGVLTAAAFI
jgi:dolichol kinase